LLNADSISAIVVFSRKSSRLNHFLDRPTLLLLAPDARFRRVRREQDREGALSAGCDRYLAKPFAAADLVSLVLELAPRINAVSDPSDRSV
jgi:hypothetical protein